MGHALNWTIQDVLIRTNRMRGRRAKWIFGTDHAGIATQRQVEKLLVTEGTSRVELGRERFQERVWEWRERYGGEIIEQGKRLGATPDYEDERFTMDERYVQAVLKVFVELYELNRLGGPARAPKRAPRALHPVPVPSRAHEADEHARPVGDARVQMAHRPGDDPGGEHHEWRTGTAHELTIRWAHAHRSHHHRHRAARVARERRRRGRRRGDPEARWSPRRASSDAR